MSGDPVLIQGLAGAKGKPLGRRPRPLPDGFEIICRRCHSGERTARNAAAALCMSNSMFCRKHCAWERKNSVSNGRLLVDFKKTLWYNKRKMSKTGKKHEIWDFYVLHFSFFRCTELSAKSLHFETDTVRQGRKVWKMRTIAGNHSALPQFFF